MNRRRFFAALAAAPVMLPSAVKAAMKPSTLPRVTHKTVWLSPNEVRALEDVPIKWLRINRERFEYAIREGEFGDEFVKLLDGTYLSRPLVEDDSQAKDLEGRAG